MDSYIAELLALSQKMEYKRMEADGIISAHPLYLFDIHLASESTGPTHNDLYHGTAEESRHIMCLHTIGDTSFNYR